MCHRVMCHNSGGVSHALMQRRRCVFVRPRCFSRTPVARGSLGIWSFFSAARDHLAAPQSQVHRPDCAIESCDMAASSDHVFDQDRDLSMMLVRATSLTSKLGGMELARRSGSHSLLRHFSGPSPSSPSSSPLPLTISTILVTWRFSGSTTDIPALLCCRGGW
jgi:hypothetical protein